MQEATERWPQHINMYPWCPICSTPMWWGNLYDVLLLILIIYKSLALLPFEIAPLSGDFGKDFMSTCKVCNMQTLNVWCSVYSYIDKILSAKTSKFLLIAICNYNSKLCCSCATTYYWWIPYWCKPVWSQIVLCILEIICLTLTKVYSYT